MSLLLALTGGVGPPTVNCTVVSGQAQTATGTTTLTLNCSGSSNQGQTVAATTTRSISSSSVSSQAQTTSATTSLSVASTAASNQVNTASGTFACGVGSTLVTNQANTSSGAFERFLNGLLSSSQGQTSSGILSSSSSVDCSGTSNQGQTCSAYADVELLRRDGTGRVKKKIPKWLKRLLKDFDEEWLDSFKEEIQTKTIEVLEEVQQEIPNYDLDTTQVKLALAEIERIKQKKIKKRRQEEELILFM